MVLLEVLLLDPAEEPPLLSDVHGSRRIWIPFQEDCKQIYQNADTGYSGLESPRIKKLHPDLKVVTFVALNKILCPLNKLNYGSSIIFPLRGDKNGRPERLESAIEPHGEKD